VEGIGIAGGGAVQQVVQWPQQKTGETNAKSKNQPAATVKPSPSKTLLHSAASSSDRDNNCTQVSQGKKQKQQWNGRTSTTQRCSTAIGVSGKSKGKANTLFLKKYQLASIQG